eukprot:PhF_6_TR14264/c0_g1_i2/m.22939
MENALSQQVIRRMEHEMQKLVSDMTAVAKQYEELQNELKSRFLKYKKLKSKYLQVSQEASTLHRSYDAAMKELTTTKETIEVLKRSHVEELHRLRHDVTSLERALAQAQEEKHMSDRERVLKSKELESVLKDSEAKWRQCETQMRQTAMTVRYECDAWKREKEVLEAAHSMQLAEERRRRQEAENKLEEVMRQWREDLRGSIMAKQQLEDTTIPLGIAPITSVGGGGDLGKGKRSGRPWK